ncbi:hypothetical protein [Methanobacterium alcaliphilum]|uniref:hypothetical protein n=1 Tax=Methanobacterium alcaliphilum TaxID=392018 RepID=UPI00200AF706|nr:hypothetical protein [Methanobacterium alcaliphilum]MCK9152468.1 hypothetical protein [Methanobacterium alcaliphilum]
MGIRKINLVFILLIAFVSCNVCWADVVEPGTKEVGLNYQIENINDYSDYVFLAHGIPNPSFQLINSSEFSFYKLSQVSIYAMQKSDYSQLDFSKMNDSSIENFFNNDKRIIKSNLNLSGFYGVVPESNPLESALMVLKIESVNPNQLNITKARMVYSYNDGSSSLENFTDQAVTPEPEDRSVLNTSIYSLIILIVILLLVLLFVKKMQNK